MIEEMIIVVFLTLISRSWTLIDMAKIMIAVVF